MLWQTCIGRCIYEDKGGRQVWQNPLFRWLTFSSAAIQSIIYRHKPSKPATRCIQALTHAPRIYPGNMLHIGLGGACVPQALRAYLPDASLVLIEKDKEVIDLARRFFYLDRVEPFELHHSCGAAFLAQNTMHFDHILVDVANSSSVPNECLSHVFFQDLAASLTEKGIVSFNLPNLQQIPQALHHLRQRFRASFLLRIPKLSNAIIYMSQDTHSEALMHRLALKRICAAVHWSPDYGLLGIQTSSFCGRYSSNK